MARFRALALVLAATATLVVAGCASIAALPGPMPTADPIPHPTEPEAPSGTVANPQVVAIGDSIMKGYGLQPSQAWPELIGAATGWRITNLACNGAGFVTVGSRSDCGSTFATLVTKAATLHPDIILISGSSNDLGVADGALNTATVAAMNSLRAENPRAQIVAISTVWGDTPPPDQIGEISDQVEQAVAAVGGEYLDIGQPLAGHREWLQFDDVHPTVQGQQVLAQAITAALQDAKILPAPVSPTATPTD